VALIIIFNQIETSGLGKC